MIRVLQVYSFFFICSHKILHLFKNNQMHFGVLKYMSFEDTLANWQRLGNIQPLHCIALVTHLVNLGMNCILLECNIYFEERNFFLQKTKIISINLRHLSLNKLWYISFIPAWPMIISQKIKPFEFIGSYLAICINTFISLHHKLTNIFL